MLIIPAKSPDSPEANNNVEQQLGVVLMELKYQRGDWISACKWTSTLILRIKKRP